jgi:hypothetical protein
MTSPADVHALAEQVYLKAAPLLGCHVLCREFALVCCGVAAALGVEHEFCVENTHCFVRFADGSRSENFFQNIRLIAPGAENKLRPVAASKSRSAARRAAARRFRSVLEGIRHR